MTASDQTRVFPKRWLIAGTLLLFILAGVRWYAGIDAAPAVVPNPTPLADRTEGTLRVRAHADKSRVAAGDGMRVWVSIEQRSGTLARTAIESFDAGGLETQGPCWSTGVPDCGAGQAAAGGLAAARRAGQGSASLWGELRAGPDLKGSRAITLLVTERDAQGTSVASVAISVGPIEVAARQRLARTVALHAYGVVKDFGLPIAGALLAFLFQSWQRSREHAQTSRNSIFPQAHSNAVQHLLPLVAATMAFHARTASSRWTSAESTEGREALYHLVMLFRQMVDLVRTGGGIFLSNLDGEMAVIYCWRWVRDAIYVHFDREALNQVVDRLDIDDTFTTFEGRFGRPSSAYIAATLDPCLVQAREGLRLWVESPGFAMDHSVLEVMRATLQYEIDILYEDWYGAPPSAPNKEVAKLADELEQTGKEDAKALARDLRAYAEKLGSRRG